MKKLTERDLSRIVKKVINEEMYENDIYSGVMDVIRNSNASTEETIDVLQMIIDEMTSSRKMRQNVVNRFRN